MLTPTIGRKLTTLAAGTARAASISRPSPAHTATFSSSARAAFGPDFDPFESSAPTPSAPRAAQASATTSGGGGGGSFAARPSASSSSLASSGAAASSAASTASPFRPQLPVYGKPVFAPSYALSGEPNPALLWNGGKQDGVDWTTTWKGLGEIVTTEEQAAKLMRPLKPEEIQIKPGTFSLAPPLYLIFHSY